MKAKLITTHTNNHIIEWSETGGLDNLGQFGKIYIVWDPKLCRYIVDTEMLGIEKVIKIMADRDQ